MLCEHSASSFVCQLLGHLQLGKFTLSAVLISSENPQVPSSQSYAVITFKVE